MKKLLLLPLLLLCGLPAFGQSPPPLKIQEVDGSPAQTNATKLIFPNGSLTRSGSTITVTFSGSGDVVGPASSTDNAIVRFDGTTGKLLQNSGVTIGDTGIVILTDGTAAAPAIRFTSATNAGLFNRGGNMVSFAASGLIQAELTNNSMQFTNSVHLGWANGAAGGAANDASFIRAGAGIIRVANGSTGQGNILLATSSGAVGASCVGCFTITNGTAPTGNSTDGSNIYNADSAAGDSNTYIRNEVGEIIRQTGLAARNSAQFDKTSSTTFSTVTGLTRNVEAGRVYAFRVYAQTTAVVTGGVKFQIGGTATATAISYEGVLTSGAALVVQTRATALATTVCASTTTTTGTCAIAGVIQVNGAGTFTVDFAQNASDASASSVLANQHFELIPIS